MLETKYTHIAEKIKSKIFEGDYPGRLPGVRTLAVSFDVSPTTIVKALKTLQDSGILESNGPSGTFVSTAGRRGRSRHWTIGVLGMSYLSGSKSIEFMEVEKIALRFKYNTIAFNNTDSSITQDPEFLQKLPVDGFIFSFSALNKDIVLALRRAGIPFVSCNRIDDIPDVSWVDYDSEQGLVDVMRYFVDGGHKRIAYFGCDNPYNNFTSKLQKRYMETSEQFGIYDPALFYARCTHQELIDRYGDRAIDEYGVMAGDFLGSLASPPTAVYCHHEYFDSLKRGLAKKGLELGHDVSVIVDTPAGVDFTGHVDGRLIIPFIDRARTASEMLFEHIGDLNARSKQLLLKKKLIVEEQNL